MKKLFRLTWGWRKNLHLRKIWMTMKLTMGLFFLAITQMVASEAYSQITKMTLQLSNVSVKEVLNRIEEDSEFFFLYNSKLVDVDRKVNVEVKNQKIDEILNNLFRDTEVVYTVVDRQIVLTNKADQAGFVRQSGQQPGKKVTGKVTDSTGAPLPGVSVVIKGTLTGVITDSNGDYSLSNIPSNSILRISFIGLNTQEIAVGNNTTIDVTLTEANIGLSEFVVVGYGTKARVTLTGAVVSATSAEIKSNPSISLTNTLSGILPGVISMQRSGEPGKDDATLLIRGLNTIDNKNGNISPLVLVDNVETSGWERLNSNDIESVSVLKDASAAIFGVRAANGVILITTKRGTSGKPIISYNFNQGLSTPTRIPQMASSYQFAEYLNDYLQQNGQAPRYTAAELQKFQDGSDPVNYPNVDWYHEVIRPVTPQSQQNINVRGGTENVKYSVSGSYGHQTSMFKGGSHDFKTYSLRSNVDLTINQYIKVGFDLNTGVDNGNYPPIVASTGTAAYLYQLTPGFPTMPVFWPNGLPSVGFVGGNPRVTGSDATGNSNNRNLRFQARGSFDITIPWVKGLGVDGYAVYSENTSKVKTWSIPAFVYNYDAVNNVYIKQSALFSPAAPTLAQSLSSGRSNLYNLRIKYARMFGDHNVNVFVAAEQQEGYSDNFSAGRTNFPTSAIDQLFAGSAVNQTNSGSASETARQNVFGRASYDFKSKYMIDFNFRYDGSANFPAGRRFGFFPGVLAAWRISQEKFMENVSFINELKLRGSYGQLGNDQVPAFQYLSTYTTDKGYNFGTPKAQSSGLNAGVSPNPLITWEVAKLVDFALSGSLWKGLFGFELDVFKQRRSNILASRGLAVPDFAAISLPNENFGVVENKGFELQLSSMKTIGDFTYSITPNVTFARNKIIDIAESANVPEWQKQTGHILGAQKLYVSRGIIRTQAEFDSYPRMVGAKVGDLGYEDINNDGKIDASDQVLYDKSNNPEVTFGTQVSLKYKNFSLWSNFAGSARSWIFFAVTGRINSNSLEDAIVNRWRPGSMDSKYPRLLTTGFVASDFWLRQSWFLRLKTLELGYDLPQKLLSKVNIASLRVYVNGNNLFTLDEVKWFDPEGTSFFGDFYPQSKIYNLGFQIRF
jgi:TonB-dependent starch-binding outer membrane protein SusC